jgi:hypothetical protein
MKTPLSMYALSGLVGAIGVAPLAAGQSQAPVVSPSSSPAKFSLVDAPRLPGALDAAPATWSGSPLDMECGSLELTQSTDPTLIEANSVWCGTLDFNAETRLARAFTAPHDLSLECVTFAVRQNTGADWPCTVRVLLGGTAAPYSSLTLLTETAVNIPAGTDREMFTAEMPALSIPSGTEFIIELVTPTRDPAAGGDGGLLALGFNSAGQSAPTYLYAEECGLTEYQTLTSIGFPNRHLALSLGVDEGLGSSNLLIDPSFEANPLMSHTAVLGAFETHQGIWGVESATISGPDGAVIPPHGDKMLRMTDAGGHSTQAFQVTDVTAHATLIDSGLARFDLGASFNADVPAASAGVGLHFFDEPFWGSPILSRSNGAVLDSDAATWEVVSVSGSIPPGARWIVSEVNYPNSTISPEPGYVDEASLLLDEGSPEVVPIKWGGVIEFSIHPEVPVGATFEVTTEVDRPSPPPVGPCEGELVESCILVATSPFMCSGEKIYLCRLVTHRPHSIGVGLTTYDPDIEVRSTFHFVPGTIIDPSLAEFVWTSASFDPTMPSTFEIVDFSGVMLASGEILTLEERVACYADCDGSGALDFFDFLCFQNAFAAGEPSADCDESGSLDFFDFLCFQNEFAAGCP